MRHSRESARKREPRATKTPFAALDPRLRARACTHLVLRQRSPRKRPSEYPHDGQTRRPRARGTRGKRLKSLGSRFRGNDGYEHESARFLGSVTFARARPKYHSSNQMCACPSAFAGATKGCAMGTICLVHTTSGSGGEQVRSGWILSVVVRRGFPTPAQAPSSPGCVRRGTDPSLPRVPANATWLRHPDNPL